MADPFGRHCVNAPVVQDGGGECEHPGAERQVCERTCAGDDGVKQSLQQKMSAALVKDDPACYSGESGPWSFSFIDGMRDKAKLEYSLYKSYPIFAK